jgi:hypothetical protein
MISGVAMALSLARELRKSVTWIWLVSGRWGASAFRSAAALASSLAKPMNFSRPHCPNGPVSKLVSYMAIILYWAERREFFQKEVEGPLKG